MKLGRYAESKEEYVLDKVLFHELFYLYGIQL